MKIFVFWCKFHWSCYECSIDNKSALVQVMAWCRQAASHYLSQCWQRSIMPHGVTGTQWVKKLYHYVSKFCNKASLLSIMTGLSNALLQLPFHYKSDPRNYLWLEKMICIKTSMFTHNNMIVLNKMSAMASHVCSGAHSIKIFPS